MQQKVGRYSILGQLGRGGMGSVYLAADPLLNRQVAIKMVDFSIDESSQRDFLRQRLLRDAKTAALLSHPNVVGVYDVVEEGDAAFVVMEYVPGESLASHLERVPIPDQAFTLSVLRQIALALDYTHGRGVLHRDIKPANVMCAPDGVVKILDFGIARVSDGRTATTAGVVMGTIEYMSPEQVKDETLDGRSDQFSMAAVAYRMLTGSSPFGQHKTAATLAYKVVHEMPRPVSERNASLPCGVDQVLMKGLAKSPSDRFDTCSEFAEALNRAFLGGAANAPPAVSPSEALTEALVVRQASPKPAPETPADSKPSHIPWLSAAACVVVLAGGLVLWKPWSRSQETQTVDVPKPASPTQTQPPPAERPPAPQNPVPQVQETVPRRVPAQKRALKVDSAKATQPERRPEAPQEPAQRKPGGRVDSGELGRLFSKGQEQIQQRDFAGAIQSFTEAIAIRPDFQRAYLRRGHARQQLDQIDGAIQDFSRAIELNPQDEFPYVGRGVCLVRMREDERALADFNRALEINPDLPVALNGRGGIFLRRRDYAQAIRDLDAALRINPQFARAYDNRARAKRALGDMTGAEADRRKAEEWKGQAQ